MNKGRIWHSQCTLDDSLFIFFGLKKPEASTAYNSIESINAVNLTNGGSANWTLIKLQSEIQPRYDSLTAQIDDNKIVILGGRDRNWKVLGEVLIFNT